jgi:hypothetical protein
VGRGDDGVALTSMLMRDTREDDAADAEDELDAPAS